MSATSLAFESNLQKEPYPGLRPYTEEQHHYFFGRDHDCRVLIDKILSNKLTLLFAASGVGKSSLLRAAVLPSIRHPEHENLDAVYYNDWVGDPFSGLRDKTLKTLEKIPTHRWRRYRRDHRCEDLKQIFSILHVVHPSTARDCARPV